MPNRFEEALGARGESLSGATEQFREFDPRDTVQRQAEAQFGAFSEDLAEDMERIRGRQVGAGRLDTGFGMEDQDRFIRDRLDRLNRTLAQNAIQVAGMRQRQLGEAAGLQGRNLQMEGRAQRQNEADEAGIGATIGAGLGLASSFIPGNPLGPEAGAKVGGGIGRGITGLF